MDDSIEESILARHSKAGPFVITFGILGRGQRFYNIIESTNRANLLQAQDLDSEPDQNNHDNAGVRKVRQK